MEFGQEIKMYLVFSFDSYYPSGGANDLEAVCYELEEAIERAEIAHGRICTCMHKECQLDVILLVCLKYRRSGTQSHQINCEA